MLSYRAKLREFIEQQLAVLSIVTDDQVWKVPGNLQQ